MPEAPDFGFTAARAACVIGSLYAPAAMLLRSMASTCRGNKSAGRQRRDGSITKGVKNMLRRMKAMWKP